MKIRINEEICLGFSHCGSVSTTAQGEFEMPDEYVETIVALIREHGTTDINELQLAELHPEVYEFLNENINKIYCIAEEAHFMRRGFAEGDWSEFDDNLIDYCERELGFEYDDEEEDYDDFYEDEYEDDEEYDEDEADEEEEDDDDDDDDYDYKRHSQFESWLRNYVETLTDQELLDFFYEHIDTGFGSCQSEYEIEIPQQIIDLANVEE